MESLRIRDKSEVWPLFPFALLWGGGWTYGMVRGVGEAAAWCADGGAIVYAAASLIVPAAMGLIFFGLMARALHDPYEVQLSDRGSIELVGWIGRTRILPADIVGVMTTRKPFESDTVTLVTRQGRVVIPWPERSWELISFVQSRNPTVIVE